MRVHATYDLIHMSVKERRLVPSLSSVGGHGRGHGNWDWVTPAPARLPLRPGSTSSMTMSCKKRACLSFLYLQQVYLYTLPAAKPLCRARIRFSNIFHRAIHSLSRMFLLHFFLSLDGGQLEAYKYSAHQISEIKGNVN